MNQVISSKVQFKIIPGICIPERISRISSLANVCFIAVNQRIERIGKQNFVGFTKAYGTTTKNHIYGDVVDLCNSVPTVREIQGGEPHFLLFLMKGLDNSSVVSVVTIFDTAASYSLFKEDILGTKIKATPVSNQNGDTFGIWYVAWGGGTVGDCLWDKIITYSYGGGLVHNIIE